jgi:hypothetical protein
VTHCDGALPQNWLFNLSRGQIRTTAAKLPRINNGLA